MGKFDEMTIGEVKELAKMFCGREQENHNGPWEIGKNYFIRTVSMYQTGRLVAAYPNELVLEDAAWIAATGRLVDVLVSCEFSEVEPFDGPIIIGRRSIVDAVQISKLPREQK